MLAWRQPSYHRSSERSCLLFTCLEFKYSSKEFRSLYTHRLYVDLYDACCSIFNEPARFQARRFRPALRDSLYIISPSPSFVNTFFQTFLSFFHFGDCLQQCMPKFAFQKAY